MLGRTSRVTGALLLAVGASLFVPRAATADPVFCTVAQQIFPTATAPAPYNWQLADGDAGRIARSRNSFPCVLARQNAWTIHALLDVSKGDYIEVGYYETGTSTIDDWHFFYEYKIGPGAAVMVNADASCGGPYQPNGGSSAFAVLRNINVGTIWNTQIDCNNTGAFNNVPSSGIYDAANPQIAIIRSEFERNSSANGFNGYVYDLGYRDWITKQWIAWAGYGCYTTPRNWTSLNLSRVSNRAWQLTTGTGTC